nr:alpha-tocopherol transfer protein-like [Leptinotarsa decemlineata]
MDSIFSGSYLISLPKTTPEGYRVLLYSVKDNDPTKMVFSDCIKAFCMYNDIILSEDGLQEGYIVVFDMKGVQLGHLARVSLPALRCFMLYIQEAHPCRLKAIHVLNTASWIHHVMRLIVPLLKSELLSLIKFHTGNIPENFPTELLPAEYGGEAATMKEFEKETEFLLGKYHHWLIESSEFKSDESKREKKASWWGLFNSSNKSNEMDEKTVLKNLQID